MEKREQRQVEMLNDMENIEENSETIGKIQKKEGKDMIILEKNS